MLDLDAMSLHMVYISSPPAVDLGIHCFPLVFSFAFWSCGFMDLQFLIYVHMETVTASCTKKFKFAGDRDVINI
jgi:hypothetical protein